MIGVLEHGMDRPLLGRNMNLVHLQTKTGLLYFELWLCNFLTHNNMISCFLIQMTELTADGPEDEDVRLPES